jgi:hypothetical protein
VRDEERQRAEGRRQRKAIGNCKMAIEVVTHKKMAGDDTSHFKYFIVYPS